MTKQSLEQKFINKILSYLLLSNNPEIVDKIKSLIFQLKTNDNWLALIDVLTDIKRELFEEFKTADFSEENFLYYQNFLSSIDFLCNLEYNLRTILEKLTVSDKK